MTYYFPGVLMIYLELRAMSDPSLLGKVLIPQLPAPKIHGNIELLIFRGALSSDEHCDNHILHNEYMII